MTTGTPGRIAACLVLVSLAALAAGCTGGRTAARVGGDDGAATDAGAATADPATLATVELAIGGMT